MKGLTIHTRSKSCEQAPRVFVRDASEHNLENVSVDIPRDALVVFTGGFPSSFLPRQARTSSSFCGFDPTLINEVFGLVALLGLEHQASRRLGTGIASSADLDTCREMIRKRPFDPLLDG